MKLHNIKMNKKACDNIVNYVLNEKSDELALLQASDRYKVWLNTWNDFIEKNKTEHLTDVSLWNDPREELIIKFYKNHKETEYMNYTSKEIDSLVPVEIFNYFNLSSENCRIDVKRLTPGKIHLPHKDYHINYKYNIVNREGKLEYIKKDNINEVNIIRLWITLTEPLFGHLLIIEDKALYWLEQGSIVTWDSHELHAAVNLGYEDRFIMTITGTVCN